MGLSHRSGSLSEQVPVETIAARSVGTEFSHPSRAQTLVSPRGRAQTHPTSDENALCILFLWLASLHQVGACCVRGAAEGDSGQRLSILEIEAPGAYPPLLGQAVQDRVSSTPQIMQHRAAVSGRLPQDGRRAVRNVPKRLEELNAELVNAVTLWMGVAVIALGTLVGARSSDLQVILVSVGTSLVASATVVYLSSRYLVRQSRAKDIIETWGLEGIYRTRAEMNVSCDAHLAGAECELDIIAFGLRSLRDSQSDLILAKVKKGLRMRVLTISPDSPFLAQRERDENEIAGQIQRTIVQLAAWVKQLSSHALRSDQVQIKFYDALPLDFYLRVDGHVYVGPYLRGKTSQQTVSYEFRGNSAGYEYWKGYFESLWADGSFAKDAS